MRISDWSSDVCSSDLHEVPAGPHQADARREECIAKALDTLRRREKVAEQADAVGTEAKPDHCRCEQRDGNRGSPAPGFGEALQRGQRDAARRKRQRDPRSEEHTSELQSLMRISYAVFCLKKKKKQTTHNN